MVYIKVTKLLIIIFYAMIRIKNFNEKAFFDHKNGRNDHA